jgi:hypothetical protein
VRQSALILSIMSLVACGPPAAAPSALTVRVDSTNPMGGGGGSSPYGGLTADERDAAVAAIEPAYGGVYLEPPSLDGQKVVVVLTKLDRLDSALAAYRHVHGDIEPSYLPARPVLGQYNAAQLVGWKKAIAGIWYQFRTIDQLDFDEFRNRVAVGVTDTSEREPIERAVVAAGVPLEAVIIEHRDAVRPL